MVRAIRTARRVIALEAHAGRSGVGSLPDYVRNGAVDVINGSLAGFYLVVVHGAFCAVGVSGS